MNWRDLKEGDRVRITLDGTVDSARSTGCNILLDGRYRSDGKTWFPFCDLDAAISIELAPHKFQPGDNTNFGTVMAVDGDSAWLKDQYGIYHTKFVRLLEVVK